MQARAKSSTGGGGDAASADIFGTDFIIRIKLWGLDKIEHTGRGRRAHFTYIYKPHHPLSPKNTHKHTYRRRPPPSPRRALDALRARRGLGADEQVRGGARGSRGRPGDAPERRGDFGGGD